MADTSVDLSDLTVSQALLFATAYTLDKMGMASRPTVDVAASHSHLLVLEWKHMGGGQPRSLTLTVDTRDPKRTYVRANLVIGDTTVVEATADDPENLYPILSAADGNFQFYSSTFEVDRADKKDRATGRN